MPAFRTIADLEEALAAAGVTQDASAIVATARPAILFVRQQVPDASLPIGASKIGGAADLPADFVWPERPAYRDAERRAANLRRAGENVRRSLAELMDAPDMPGSPQIAPQQLDDIAAEYEGKCAALFAPLPLGFVAQLDLAALSREVGFAAELPKHGLLSIFRDVTGNRSAAFWHAQPPSALRRTDPPQTLIDYYDAYGHHPEDDRPWRAGTMAEVLHPFSAVTIPHHWRSAARAGAQSRQIADLLDNHAFRFHPELPAGSYFGDRLGGWPENIQGHPEEEIAGDGTAGQRIARPGETPWRHVFSYGGECYGGTQLMPRERGGDGNEFIMIHERDLAERRFDKAGNVYQQT